MKKALLTLMLMVATLASTTATYAQDFNNPKYLKGAVTEESGFVVFRHTYECPGRSQQQIYDALEPYTRGLVKSKVSLPQSRITQLTPEDGTIAASMEETLTFKSTNWVLDTARFFFQLVFVVEDGKFEVMLRRIHYIYEVNDVPDYTNNYAAEDWITDRAALSRKGKLTRVSGKKFRRCTIDRKDEIFQNAYNAVMQ